MRETFYDKIAKKFGGYGYGDGKGPEYFSEYRTGDPEEVFKKNILKLASRDKIALDIGCADGKFTLTMAPYFKKIYGIDNSWKNLEIAQKNKIRNVFYSLEDAQKTSFKSNFFDLVYNRRGPSFFNEYHRLLKPGGYYLEIGIGEKDAQELKEIFGRGQGFGKWDKSELEQNVKDLKKLGFKMVFKKDYFYNEYYASFDDLELFLQKVPIFEDYDIKKDKKYLQKYVNKFSTDKGIELPRHRLVLVGRKK